MKVKNVLCIALFASGGSFTLFTPPALAAALNRDPIAEVLVRVLYPTDSNASARSIAFALSPEFKGRYIVAAYVTPATYSFSPIPVEVAVVQIEGDEPVVLARNSFEFTLNVPRAESLSIDTANYWVTKSERAFGVRTYGRDSGSGFEFNYDSIDLFLQDSGTIRHIAGDLDFGGGALGSSDEYQYCNNLQVCPPVWHRERSSAVILMDSRKTNGHFNLVCRTTKVNEDGRSVPVDSVTGSSTHRSVRLLKWNGSRYEMDAGGSTAEEASAPPR